MEIGAEISQKIRSAIKSKLVDLGAYVDDELPDYIMVMVANKKTQAQMTEDLNLFLGNNTEKFTQWLDALLNKLQSLTAGAPAKPADSQEIQTNEAITGLAGTDAVLVTRQTVQTDEQTVVQPAEKEQKPPDESQPTVVTVEYQEEELKIMADTDEFAEEPVQEPAPKKTVVKKEPVKKEVVKTSASTKQPLEHRTGTVLVSKVSPKVSSPVRPIHHTSRVTSHRRLSPEGTLEKRTITQHVRHGKPSSEVPSKLRSDLISARQGRSSAEVTSKVRSGRVGPGSVVGSVVKHDRQEEEEEEYDPYNPAIGNVASVVRVTERRSSVPPSLQANKSLLMRAMREAKDSVEKHATRGQAEAVVVKPVQVTMRPLSRVEPQLHYSSTPKQMVQLFSRSKREEMKGHIQTTIQVVQDEAEHEESISTLEEESALDDLLDDTNVSIEVTGDSQLLHSEEPEVTQEPVQGDPDLLTLVESEPEDSEFKESQTDDSRQIEDSSIEVLSSPASPKFVVTLEGVDPGLINREDEYDDESLEPVRNIMTRKRRAAPHDDSLEDVEEEETEESSQKFQKLAERCKFWPGCKNGDQCPYHHPTVQCKSFPRCTFGEKCRFIHPNCKFDAKCTRGDCPFTHASKRAPSSRTAPTVVIQPIRVPVFTPKSYNAPSQPHQIKCHFFPKCTNMNCPYLHPKPCRYGLSCTKKQTCPFTHPSLPEKDKLRWKAGGGTASAGNIVVTTGQDNKK